MKNVTLKILQSPSHKGRLKLTNKKTINHETLEGKLIDTDNVFFIKNGVADLTYPNNLLDSDRSFREKYNLNASDYQTGMDWLFAVFSEHEEIVRKQMTDILAPKDNELILDIGCGTGKDAATILSSTIDTKVILADISRAMLEEAILNLKMFKPRTDFLICNASYLPFKNNSFDRIFHFGGINEFGDKAQAIKEFNRVVKVGGKVVFGDEGIAPWLGNNEYGKILKSANPLYKHYPPIELLPATARNVKLHWVLGNAFYLIEFEKNNKQMPLNIDLPIPGKRGGTLKSRYKNK